MRRTALSATFQRACGRKSGVILSAVEARFASRRRSRKISSSGLASYAWHSWNVGKKSPSVAENMSAIVRLPEGLPAIDSSEYPRFILRSRRCQTALGDLSTPSSARKPRLDGAQDDTVFSARAPCRVALNGAHQDCESRPKDRLNKRYSDMIPTRAPTLSLHTPPVQMSMYGLAERVS